MTVDNRAGPALLALILVAAATANAAADGSDSFWLNGELQISPREQTAFLARLIRGELPVSEKAYSSLREVAWLDE